MSEVEERPFVAEWVEEQGRPSGWESRSAWSRGSQESYANNDPHRAEVTLGCLGASSGSQACLVWLSECFKKGEAGC